MNASNQKSMRLSFRRRIQRAIAIPGLVAISKCLFLLNLQPLRNSAATSTANTLKNNPQTFSYNLPGREKFFPFSESRVDRNFNIPSTPVSTTAQKPKLRLDLESLLYNDFTDYDYDGRSSNFEARLMYKGNPHYFMGRIEVKQPGTQWGSICGDGWTNADAYVACRQLGFKVGGVLAERKAIFGYGMGPIVLSKVKCRGNEKSLEECYADRWDGHKSLPCSRFMSGASVICGCSMEDNPNIQSRCFLRTGTETRTGSFSCLHHCSDGMILVGSRLRTCQADQTWTGIKPYCVNQNLRRKECIVKKRSRMKCHRGESLERSEIKCLSQGCCYDNSSLIKCFLPASSVCMDRRCKNGAECRDDPVHVNNYQCVCTDKYWGEHCERIRDWKCGIQSIQPNLSPVRRVKRIVGGSRAVAGSWPWVVQLNRDGKHLCGGTLIHRQWILTAAHCIIRNQNLIDGITVSVGHNPKNSNPSVFEVDSVQHANYENITIPKNDIALLKLKTPVTVHKFTNILCLPRHREDSPLPGTKCWVAGWGDTYSGEKLSERSFHQADIPILSREDCRSKKDFDKEYGLVTEDMICAGYATGGVDTCQGDSGGPLMCQRPSGSWYVSGIVSFGYKCGDENSPGVYTRVSHYLKWIYFTMTQE